jgi:hypothetical protein
MLHIQLDAQWAESEWLTCHFVLRKLYTLSCTQYGMVISRWRIVHRQKGRCEDFDYYRSL